MKRRAPPHVKKSGLPAATTHDTLCECLLPAPRVPAHERWPYYTPSKHCLPTPLPQRSSARRTNLPRQGTHGRRQRCPNCALTLRACPFATRHPFSPCQLCPSRRSPTLLHALPERRAARAVPAASCKEKRTHRCPYTVLWPAMRGGPWGRGVWGWACSATCDDTRRPPGWQRPPCSDSKRAHAGGGDSARAWAQQTSAQSGERAPPHKGGWARTQ